MVVVDGKEEFEVQASDGCVLRGLRYSCADSGDSHPTALCLHGFAADAESMHWVASAFNRLGIDAVVPDLRSQGLSDSARSRKLKPAQLAKDVVDLCKELGLYRVLLVTQSFGGWVGLHLLRQDTPGLQIDQFYAFAPNWFSERRKRSEMKDWIPRTARILWRLGRLRGFLSKATPSRIDYASYAGRPDFYLPRMHQESRSMSWPTYAIRFVALQDLGHHPCPDWKSLASLPISIFAAKKDRLVENTELEEISALTGWSLDWIDCGHLGVATEKQHADAFVRAIASRL